MSTKKDFLRQGEGRLGSSYARRAEVRASEQVSNLKARPTNRTLKLSCSKTREAEEEEETDSFDGDTVPTDEHDYPEDDIYPRVSYSSMFLKKHEKQDTKGKERMRGNETRESQEWNRSVDASYVSCPEGRRISDLQKPALLAKGKNLGSPVKILKSMEQLRSPSSRSVQDERQKVSEHTHMVDHSNIEASAIDFSPLLQAIQGQLASSTQENIVLKEQVETLRTELSQLEKNYEMKLAAAEARIENEKEKEMEKVIQKIRVRDRQNDAINKHKGVEKLKKEAEYLAGELRRHKQEAYARESVLNMNIDKLRRANERLQVENEELKERLVVRAQALEMDGGISLRPLEHFGALHTAQEAASKVRKSTPPNISISSSSPQRDTESMAAAQAKLAELVEAEAGDQVQEGSNRDVNSITYRNGSVKDFLPDGRRITKFPNGDIKEDCPDGSSTYFYRDANTTHITYKDGTQLIHFPNNQMERHFPDGSREVVFPDKTRCRFAPDGTKTVTYGKGA